MSRSNTSSPAQLGMAASLDMAARLGKLARLGMAASLDMAARLGKLARLGIAASLDMAARLGKLARLGRSARWPSKPVRRLAATRRPRVAVQPSSRCGPGRPGAPN